MNANTGQPDRLIRTFAAVILIAMGVGGILSGVAATVSIVVGVILALTALVGFCPLYAVLKKDTMKMGE